MLVVSRPTSTKNQTSTNQSSVPRPISSSFNFKSFSTFSRNSSNFINSVPQQWRNGLSIAELKPNYTSTTFFGNNLSFGMLSLLLVNNFATKKPSPPASKGKGAIVKKPHSPAKQQQQQQPQKTTTSQKSSTAQKTTKAAPTKAAPTKTPPKSDKSKKLDVDKKEKQVKVVAQKEKAKLEKEKVKVEKAKLKEKAKKDKEKEEVAKDKEKKQRAKQLKEAKPKRAITPFSLYVQDKFPQVQKELNAKSVTQVMPVLASRWKEINATEKKKYEAQSQKDKERFEKEFKVYKQTLPPKRPLSSYMVFSKKERKKLMEEQPDLAITVISKLLGDKWGSLTPEQRQPFEKESQKLKDQYKEKVEKFNSTKE